MTDEDLLQCPLLRGLDAMHRAELLGLLNDSNLRTNLEKCLTGRPNAAVEGESPACSVAAPAPRPNFEKEVRSWNPDVPLWRRSNKE
jgi:hypothetical protein